MERTIGGENNMSQSGERLKGGFCPVCKKKGLRRFFFKTFSGKIYCRECSNYFEYKDDIIKVLKNVTDN
jgi:hypothetical protein